MELQKSLVEAAADVIGKLSFPDGVLPLGIEGRKLIAEAVLEEIKALLAPPPQKVVGDMKWEQTDDGSSFTNTVNAIYQAKVEKGVAKLGVHGQEFQSDRSGIVAGATVEDAMRAAVEYDRWLTAVSKFRQSCFPVEAVAEGRGPSLVYRMHDFDDWGLIRNRNGSVFASIRRPVADGEMAAHRENGTDPYEAIALLLMDAVERAGKETHSDRSSAMAICAGLAEQHKVRNELASEDIRTSSWERTEARYRATAASEILSGIQVLSTTMPVETPHFDDLAVERFAVAMKEKLAKKRADGYGGWSDPAECTTEFLSDLLVNHANKRDPVDVGNFAMMIHQRGATIANDRERYADMARNRPHHKFEFPKRERLRDRILAAPDDCEIEAGGMHPEGPTPKAMPDSDV